MKGYKLLATGNETFSTNKETIINKRNEIEQQYIKQILENSYHKLLLDEEFQKEVLKDFEWEHFGSKPIYTNNPVVRYINSNGAEITQIYCNYIDEDDINLECYRSITLEDIEILE